MSMKTMAQALAEADEEAAVFLSPEAAMKRLNIGSGEDAYSNEAWEWHEHEAAQYGGLCNA